MRLNPLGQLVRSHWLKLPHHHTHVELDEWVVMPNHIHGILIFNNPRMGAAGGRGVALGGRGAALGQDVEDTTDISNPNATPSYDRPHTHDHSNATPSYDRPHVNSDRLSAEPGVAFGQEPLSSPLDGLPNAAPLPPRLGAGTVGAVVLNFKSVTTRSRNRIKRSPGSSMWQRNYYEYIIRNEESLSRIRQYIHNNPLMWQEDQLHPGNPSKW